MSDYEDFLKEQGITEALARAISETPDVVPDYTDSYYVDNSMIQGQGVYASRNYEPGDSIGRVRIGVNRTNAGRYTNHARYPNAIFEWRGGELYLVAGQRIDPNEEVTVNYRYSMQASQASLNQVVAELVTLNKAIKEILCFQKLQSMRYAAKLNYSSMGQSASADVEGQSVPSDISLPAIHTNGTSS